MKTMHAWTKTKDSETKMHVPGCHWIISSMPGQRKIGSKDIYSKGRYSAFVNSPAKGRKGGPKNFLEKVSGLKFISIVTIYS